MNKIGKNVGLKLFFGIHFLSFGFITGTDESTPQSEFVENDINDVKKQIEDLQLEREQLRTELTTKQAALSASQEMVSRLQGSLTAAYNRSRSFIYNGEHTLADLRALAFEIYSSNFSKQTKVDWLCLLAHAGARLSVTLSAHSDNKRVDDLTYLEKLVKMVAHEIDVEAEAQNFQKQLGQKAQFIAGYDH